MPCIISLSYALRPGPHDPIGEPFAAISMALRSARISARSALRLRQNCQSGARFVARRHQMIRRAAALTLALTLSPALLHAQDTVLTVNVPAADVYKGPTTV